MQYVNNVSRKLYTLSMYLLLRKNLVKRRERGKWRVERERHSRERYEPGFPEDRV